MSNLARVNRELARLDAELRAKRIDRAAYGARRRKLLLDLDELDSTTAPAERPFDSPEPIKAPASETVKSPRRMGAPAIGAVLLVVILLVAYRWFRPPTPPATDAGGVQDVPTEAEPLLPQGVANNLLQSTWSDEDVRQFLEQWASLPPAAIHAASDDPRIWLLRGEVEQRLRAARDAQSVDSTDQARNRTELLQRTLDTIRAP